MILIDYDIDFQGLETKLSMKDRRNKPHGLYNNFQGEKLRTWDGPDWSPDPLKEGGDCKGKWIEKESRVDDMISEGQNHLFFKEVVSLIFWTGLIFFNKYNKEKLFNINTFVDNIFSLCKRK